VLFDLGNDAVLFVLGRKCDGELPELREV